MIIRVHALVKSIDGKTLTLTLDDAQELHVALPEPAQVQIGDECTITIQPKAEAELSTAELSRAILSSIITEEQIQNPPKANA